MLLGLLAGCPEKPKPPAEVVDAGAPIVDAGAVEADAGGVDAGAATANALPVPFTVALVQEDGGLEVATADESGVAPVEPSKEILVTVDVPVADVRVRLFDWTDRIVPSDDEAQPSDGGVAWRIGLQEPLETGRHYNVTIDAQVGTRLLDTRGQPYEDGQLKLAVRGEIARPAPKKKPHRKKHK